MFAVTNAGGMASCLAPDVCKTPSPGGPVPIPYPNIVTASLLDASTLSKKVIIAGGMAANLKTESMLSNGDEPGVAGGVISSKVMGKLSFIMGSMKVKIEGKSAVRMSDPTMHNDKNTSGIFSAPSQAKVMVG